MLKKLLSVFILITAFLCKLQAQNVVDMVVANLAYRSGTTDDFNKGEFITIRGMNGFESRVYAAGPEDATAGILIVHDFFGITPATKESVERLGAMGYRTIAVDLYLGKFASTQDSAQALMQGKVRTETDLILEDATKYLKRPGRKLATVGFSAGGIDAVNAALIEPASFNATVLFTPGIFCPGI